MAESSLAELMGDRVLGNPEGADFRCGRLLRVDDTRVHLRFAIGQHDAVAQMESGAMARRAHAALDFRRGHCDVGADTGF